MGVTRRRVATGLATGLAALIAPVGALASTWHLEVAAPGDPAGCDATQAYRTLDAIEPCLADGDHVIVGAGTFAHSGPFPYFSVDHDVTITGAGARATTISGSQLLVADTATVSVTGITFTAAQAGVGGIRNEGALTLTDVVVRDLTENPYAAITSWEGNAPPSSLTLVRTTIRDNGGEWAGGLNVGSPALIVNSTIANNVGGSAGGILHGGAPTLHIENSTITGNVATEATGSGGIKSFGWDPVALDNTLIAGNSGPSGPDCQGRFVNGTAGRNLLGTLYRCGLNESRAVTVSGDPTGGSFTLGFAGSETVPIAFDATAADLKVALETLPAIGPGDIVAVDNPVGDGLFVIVTFVGDLAAADQPELTVASSALSGGSSPQVHVYNYGDGMAPAQATIANGVGGNLVGSANAPIDARLGAVGNYGGAVDTVPLLAGSPAISAGAGTLCQAPDVAGLDGRGTERGAAYRSVCDIGAFDTGGTGPMTCNAATPRVSWAPPRVAQRPGSPWPYELVLSRVRMWRWTGATWAAEIDGPVAISFTAGDQRTPLWWNAANGTPITGAILAPPAGYWIAVQETARLDPLAQALLDYDSRIVQAVTGNARLIFGPLTVCGWAGSESTAPLDGPTALHRPDVKRSLDGVRARVVDLLRKKAAAYRAP